MPNDATPPRDARFAEKYGPWALVAGASEGLGAAFASLLASKGLNLVLVARREAELEALARSLRGKFGIEVVTAPLDLGDNGLAKSVEQAIRNREIGLVVYNAAYSEIGEFLDQSLEGKLKTLDVNCRAPLILSHLLGKDMAARGRGGILLMSSLAGFQGSAMVAVYAATKAFNTVLGEGLWDELRRRGVDVVPFVAGATTTPNFLKSEPKGHGGVFAPPLMSPEAVAEEALDSLGKGPHAVAGRGNRVALFMMDRFIGRRARVQMMGRATRKMYSRRTPSSD